MELMRARPLVDGKKHPHPQRALACATVLLQLRRAWPQLQMVRAGRCSAHVFMAAAHRMARSVPLLGLREAPAEPGPLGGDGGVTSGGGSGGAGAAARRLVARWLWDWERGKLARENEALRTVTKCAAGERCEGTPAACEGRSPPAACAACAAPRAARAEVAPARLRGPPRQHPRCRGPPVDNGAGAWGRSSGCGRTRSPSPCPGRRQRRCSPRTAATATRLRSRTTGCPSGWSPSFRRREGSEGSEGMHPSYEGDWGDWGDKGIMANEGNGGKLGWLAGGGTWGSVGRVARAKCCQAPAAGGWSRSSKPGGAPPASCEPAPPSPCIPNPKPARGAGPSAGQ